MKKIPKIKPNIVDKIVNYFNPLQGAKRLRSRTAMALLGGYTGGSRIRRSLKEWQTLNSDADAAILPDLPLLRERSRDLIRNNSLASGVIKTKVTNVIGTGLKLQSRIDRGAVNISDEKADAWEANTEREWKLFWESKECDITRTMAGREITRLVYRQVKENGDVFVLMTRKKRKFFPYDLRLQVIEADRICNPDNAQDTVTLAGGVETDNAGAPLRYHILSDHPGTRKTYKKSDWRAIPAFGKNLGLRNIIHLFAVDRPGQSRGVPDLASVIEPLKQLGRYTDAELMAAVISGLFTVFVESESGDPTFDLSDMSDETGSASDDDDYKLGNGSIVGLAPGEKIHDSNPGRPNVVFDPFTQSILRQIGVALEIPFEILIKHFTSSYSAARAALLEAWKYFLSERTWLTDNFLRVVYEIWMHEAVASGRISAPGFLADPIIRKAYLGSDWVGPAKGQIDELKEIKAARERIESGTSNISVEAAEMGRDWEKLHPQSVKEHNARQEAGLIIEKEEEQEIEVETNANN